MQQQQDESINEVFKSNIVCSDGILIDAEPFKRESRVVKDAYRFKYGSTQVESNSEIINDVKLFCEKRAKIQDHFAHDKILFQQNLNEFYSEFRQIHQINALHLMIAAFDLGMKSLIDFMMEDVDEMFTKMTNADEFYNIFTVNLNGQKDRVDKYEFMKDNVEDKQSGWAFQNIYKSVNIVCSDGLSMDPKYFKRESRIVQQLCYQNYSSASKSVAEENNNWDPELLKVPFNGFKTLTPEKRRLWLTSHFLLRRRVSIMEQPVYERVSVSIKVEGKIKIIVRVDFFLARRAQIHYRYGNDKTLLDQKLNEFYSVFRQRYRIYALDLMIAAFDLEIKSLIDVMMEDIDDMFTKMTTDDEVYKIFTVNLNGQDDEFQSMKDDVEDKKYGWAFERVFSKNSL